MPADRLVKALDSAIKGTFLTTNSVHTEESKKYSVANVTWSCAKLGLRHADNTLPIKSMLESLEKAGLKPHTILRIPRDVGRSIETEPIFVRKSNYYYSHSQVASMEELTVTLDLPIRVILLLRFNYLILPILMILATVWTTLIARNKLVPIEQRLRLFRKLQIFTSIGMVVFPLSILYLIRNRLLPTIFGLWIDYSSMGISLFVFIGIFAIWPMVPLFLESIAARLVQKKLGLQKYVFDVLQPTQEEKTQLKRMSLLSKLPWIPFIAIFFVWNRFFSRDSALYHFDILAGIVVLFAGQAVISRLTKWRLSRLTQLVENDIDDFPSEDLQRINSRVREIASRMGVQPREVQVKHTIFNRQFMMAEVKLRGPILLSRKLAETLLPEELDFVLAHELAHYKGKHTIKILTYLIVSGLFGLALLVLTMAREWIPMSMWKCLLAICISTWIPTAISFPWFSKRWEYQADKWALETTRNLQAAVSSLSKVMEHSLFPFMNEVEELSPHPKLSKRIKALKRIACELTLPDCE